jgi:hypothetical protein
LNPSTTIGPNGYYCSSDARTLAPQGSSGKAAGDIMDGAMRIELRYSSNCNAAWARLSVAYPYNLCNNDGYAMTDSPYNAAYYSFVYPACTAGGSWYSNMVSDTTGQTAKACARYNPEMNRPFVCTGSY